MAVQTDGSRFGASARETLKRGVSSLGAFGRTVRDSAHDLAVPVNGSFAGLRALLSPRHGSRSPHAARRRRTSLEGAGRWALGSRKVANGSAATEADRVEQIARTLLRRYGVVFLRMLEREAGSLPKWRDLLRVAAVLRRGHVDRAHAGGAARAVAEAGVGGAAEHRDGVVDGVEQVADAVAGGR